MSQKLSVKIAGILIMVMMVIMTIFTIYFVKSRTESMEAELLSKGRIEAMTGAKMMEELIEEQINNNRFTLDEAFDTNYIPIPNTNPQKYHTKYDSYLDKSIQDTEDAYLKDEQVVFGRNLLQQARYRLLQLDIGSVVDESRETLKRDSRALLGDGFAKHLSQRKRLLSIEG